MHGIRPAAVPGGAYDPQSWPAETASPYGALRHARSPLHHDGAPADWSRPPVRWGTDLPSW
ncbi:hypothetical protein [Saccharothrix sp. ST-888]|uniref:hypothetical protein n=1 Tax=Saccharothrix sp. ST-888 TaxID=1427391 RepID=UPI0018CE4547|nr:hypothetical protein [Saccharothrix sp. ST-888]